MSTSPPPPLIIPIQISTSPQKTNQLILKLQAKNKIKIYKNGKLINECYNLITDLGLNRLAINALQQPTLYLSTDGTVPQASETTINANTDLGSFALGAPSVDFSGILPVATYTIDLPAGVLPSGAYASLGIKDHNAKITRALIKDSQGNHQAITIDQQDTLLIEYAWVLNVGKKIDTGDAIAHPVNLARDGFYYQGNYQDLCGSIQNNNIDYVAAYQTDNNQIINNIHNLSMSTTQLGVAEIDLTLINSSNQIQTYNAVSVVINSNQYYLEPTNGAMQIPANTTARIVFAAKVQN